MSYNPCLGISILLIADKNDLQETVTNLFGFFHKKSYFLEYIRQQYSFQFGHSRAYQYFYPPDICCITMESLRKKETYIFVKPTKLTIASVYQEVIRSTHVLCLFGDY